MRIVFACLCLVAVAMGAHVSRAASLIVLADGRSASLGGNPAVTPAPGASLFHPVLTDAFRVVEQDTTLSADSFSGKGYVSGEPGCCDSSTNVFDVSFTVDSRTAFSLTTDIGSTLPSPAPTAYLSDSTGAVTSFPSGSPSVEFSSLTGTFDPAVQYRLVFSIQDFYGEIPQVWQFSLALPEPSATTLAGLVCLALAGLGRFAWATP
ncbi:MAG TPA: hypothetical protein VEN47_13680 [Myxococcota bacterium]|nr:hypothetical protein [Myxococcota bacterium]